MPLFVAANQGKVKSMKRWLLNLWKTRDQDDKSWVSFTKKNIIWYSKCFLNIHKRLQVTKEMARNTDRGAINKQQPVILISKYTVVWLWLRLEHEQKSKQLDKEIKCINLTDNRRKTEKGKRKKVSKWDPIFKLVWLTWQTIYSVFTMLLPFTMK